MHVWDVNGFTNGVDAKTCGGAAQLNKDRAFAICGFGNPWFLVGRMNQADVVNRLLAWFARNARDLPWRRTCDPYAVWVSEVMLQQTQVKTVLPYWTRWLKALPTIASLARARPEKIHKLWEGLGYYTRVRNLQRAARVIVDQHGGKFPEQFDDVLALPGIGRYTAGAICSIAFNQPTAILDGNVIRVLCRLFAIRGNPKERSVNQQLWDLAGRLVQLAEQTQEPNSPQPHKRTIDDAHSPIAGNASARAGACSLFNQALMELGALVCTPGVPDCEVCPLKSHCIAYQRGLVSALPTPIARARLTPRWFAAFILLRRGRYLVRQRPEKGVNAHLWEFPNLELRGRVKDCQAAARELLWTDPKGLELVQVVKHTITRYKITLEVYRVQEAESRTWNPRPGERWCRLEELAELPFTAAHRKVAQRLRQR